MSKEENLDKQFVNVAEMAESLEMDIDLLAGIIANYTSILSLEDEITLDKIPNTTKTWKEIAIGLSCALAVDYTPKGNLRKYADEIYALAKFRVNFNVFPEEKFTIPELLNDTKEIINNFENLLLKLKALDPDCIEETAEEYIEKEKIPVVTCYSIDRVAYLCKETPETIKNFCVLEKYIDESGMPTVYGIGVKKYFYSSGYLTEAGKDHIVSVFYSINQSEKGMKSSSIGKAE